MAGGGVEDVYGEDRATEEQLITPWSFSVASGHQLLRDPRHNKGLAFSEAERDAHYLRGLLPPAIVSQEHQEKKIMHNLRSYTVPLHRYIAMMDLQERNERLFYKLLIDNVEELLPVVYTPVVGEACQKYGSIYRRPQGLYISLKDKGKVLEVLKNWPERSIQVIVVTDGERILGLGDLGCQGMGIPVGKLSLYTALGGVRPSACLPITIDVGTNNETLLNDEYYIGLRQRRATGEEYHELLQEFMNAVKQNYGEKVLVQFEDFANHNAFDLLAKYSKSHLVFNDDIQVLHSFPYCWCQVITRLSLLSPETLNRNGDVAGHSISGPRRPLGGPEDDRWRPCGSDLPLPWCWRGWNWHCRTHCS
uniref:Malic enzyme N-terminal domain-containing protein n=1 Tax=Aegilops tauschii subsp. strangulata TaxID=200361 RepID=A0A452Y5Q4_AEGTS